MPTVEIPYKPRPQQVSIHEALKRFNVLVCHRRFGKTVLAINELIKSNFACKHPRPRHHYIAPLYKQAKTVAWDYLCHFSRPIPGVDINQSELRVDYPGGGRIQLLGADNPDSLRGIYSDGAVIDEPAQCPINLYGEIVRPALADRTGWVVFIGTPAGHDHFYDRYQRALRDPAWYVRIFRASETGILSQEELDQAAKEMTAAEYAQEFECDFDISSNNILIPIQLINEAIGRNISYMYAPRIMGVDVGMSMGGDSSAIVIRQGSKITHVHEFWSDDTLQIAETVRRWFREYHCTQGYIDGLSWGAGVAHLLKAWGLNFSAVNVSESSADPERFVRLRDELWWRGREFFQDKLCSIDPNIEIGFKLASELSSVEYKRMPNGKIKVQGKDEMDASPNLADAFIITLMHSAAAALPAHDIRTGTGGIVLQDYQPSQPGGLI